MNQIVDEVASYLIVPGMAFINLKCKSCNPTDEWNEIIEGIKKPIAF